MDLRVEVIETRRGPREALIVTPDREVVVGRDRLSALRGAARRGATEPGAIDETILHQARRHPDAHFLIFRAKDDDGACRYRFDEGLDDAEARELAALMVRSQMTTYRELVGAGMHLLLHAELGFREVELFRSESRAALADLEAGGGDPGAALDAWILQHLTYFFAISYAKLVSETLPSLLPLLEQRAPQLRDRVEAARLSAGP